MVRKIALVLYHQVMMIKDYFIFLNDWFIRVLKYPFNLKFRMSDVYCDHMVLQRDKLLRIRGHASPGARVTLSFAGYDKDTFAGINGNWCIILPPISKGGPYTMKVCSGWRRLVFRDIIMGEVWLVTGASFMRMHLWGASTATKEINLWKKHLEEGNQLFPLRIFTGDFHLFWYRFPFPYYVCRYFNKYKLLLYPHWKTVTAQTVGSIPAYPYYFAKEISISLDVPVGLVDASLSGCPTESYVERELLEERMPDLLKGKSNPYFFSDFVGKVRKKNLMFAFNKYQKHFYDPGYAFESKIRSLDAYPIKGALFGGIFWHKDLALRFIPLFSMMVSCWRRNWQEDIPVYFLQPGRFRDERFMSSGLPEMRDVTRRVSDIVPDTYLIIAYDMVQMGEKDVIHPKERSVVGWRFGRSALYHTYGCTDIIPSGPKYLQAVLEDNLIRIRFEWSEGLHTSDGKEPAEFEISTDDCHFVPVVAKIENGQIVIENNFNSTPVYIRHAWKEYPDVNVVNSQEWPLSTFCEKIVN